MPKIAIKISIELIRLVDKLAEQYSSSTGADPKGFYLDYYLNVGTHLAMLYPIGIALGISSSHKVLEIGSGLGTKCLLGKAIWDADFTGVEPCLNTYGLLYDAIFEFKKNNPHLPYTYVNAVGENTGLPLDCFDFILSFEVLEHVQDPLRVIQEIHRLLKRGGKAFLSTCSYNSFYEGHYRCLWFPFLDRKTGKSLVKFLGYNPHFLDKVNLIKRSHLLDCFKRAGFKQIKLGYRYQRQPPPELEVDLPANYALTSFSKRKSFIQDFIQMPEVHNFLSVFGLEYKIYIEAIKK